MRLKFKNNLPKIMPIFFVFIGFFLFFFLRNHYYLPATLEIRGNFTQKTEAVLSWDSGRGFNQNEVLPVVFEAQTTSKTIELPQLGIRGLKLTNKDPNVNLDISFLLVKSENGEQILSLDKPDEVISAKVNHRQLVNIQPFLVVMQILLALLISWLVFELLNLKYRFRKPNWQSTFKSIFLEEKRWTFWLMSFVSILIFSFWLLGQWPGAVSPDSFYQLYQTKSLVLNNAHPYLHTLYLLTLMQFYDSFGAVAIFQLLATSFLGSYIFYFVIRNGLKFYLILPFFLAFVFSIPIGLFNIIIWKDVPFSLLVLFWGFYLFYLGYQKKKGIKTDFSFKKIAILAFLFILTVLIRHNGFLYLLVLPLILLLGQLMPRKILIKFFLVSAIFFLIFKSLLPNVLGVQNYTSNFSSLIWKINPLVNLISSKSYISDNLQKDKEIVEKIVAPDNIQKYFYSSSPWDVIAYTSFANLKEEDVKEFNQLFYKRVLSNLPIFLAERTERFFTLLSPRVSAWGNDYQNPDSLKSYIYLWRSGTSLYIQFTPVVKLMDFQAKLLILLSRFEPIIYDLLYPTLFLLVILLLYKWLPLSSRANFFILSQLPFWFVFTLFPEFRYLYFIYLYYFFAFPLLILEITLNRDLASKSILKNPRIFNFLLVMIYLFFIIPYIVGGVLIYHYWGSIGNFAISLPQGNF